MRIRNHMFRLNVLCCPLVSASRTFDQFPLIGKQHFQIAVIPLSGLGLPGTFDAAGGCVYALAGAETVLPAQALLLDRSAFWLGTHKFRVARTVSFAKGMAAGDERDGLLIVHGHARKGFADIAARANRVWVAVRAFGVYINQAHLHGG